MTSKTEVSRRLYGGVLEFDGAGFYPGIELINLVVSSVENRPLDPSADLRVIKRSQDFARRLGWQEDFHKEPRCMDIVGDTESAHVLRALLRCLQLEIPNSKKEPRWERVHFFPYTRSLVHWDARERKAKKGVDGPIVRTERIYLRGGGALAYRILRSDPDTDRLNAVRDGFDQLFSVTDKSPLEYLVTTLKDAGYSDTQAGTDEIELESESRNDGFEDIYRDGIARILGHDDITSPARVRAILSWTAFWMLLMQYRRSLESLQHDYRPLICDCGSGRPQLRRASQMSLKDAQQVILSAVSTAAPELGDKAFSNFRAFFVASAATVGLLNAWSGRRHFTFGTDLLETIVLATVPKGKEVTFERFVSETLGDRLGLVAGRGAAEQAGLLANIDASVFEENETRLAAQMAAAGLMTQYSDATRMVSSEGLS